MKLEKTAEKKSVNRGAKTGSRRNLELIITAMLMAVIILMTMVPILGYIPLGVINATIVHIPVILGSVVLGKKKGAFLGFVFGLTSFYNNTFRASTLSAFVFSPVIAYNQIGISGVWKSTFICFVPRILVGIVPALVFPSLMKTFKKASEKPEWNISKTFYRSVSLGFAGFAGSITNTLLVMGGIYVLYRDAYAAATGVAAEALINVIVGIVCFNGIIESALAAFITVAVGSALYAAGLIGDFGEKSNV